MPHDATANTFRVVCLAGSAGGLQAYVDILRGIPPDTGMAFVIASHRALDGADLLPSILRRATKMPVVEVVQGMCLEPNQVFLMPPHIDMTTDENVFVLRTSGRPPGWPKTINIFLYSLAEEKRDQAVAVILSGLDHDGSAALKSIKAAGGITFAQSDAAYDDMPRHAVETGNVDFHLSSSAIAAALLNLVHERSDQFTAEPPCDNRR